MEYYVETHNISPTRTSFFISNAKRAGVQNQTFRVAVSWKVTVI